MPTSTKFVQLRNISKGGATFKRFENHWPKTHKTKQYLTHIFTIHKKLVQCNYFIISTLALVSVEFIIPIWFQLSSLFIDQSIYNV